MSSPSKLSPSQASNVGPRISPRLQALKAAKKAEMKKKQQNEKQLDVVRDPFDNALEAKDIVRGRTGLIYSEEMLKHENLWDSEHIERPERLKRSFERCQALGLADRCHPIAVRKASDQEIKLAHTDKHIEILKNAVKMSPEGQKELCMRNYHSVYIGPNSEDSARFAVGAAIDLTEAVISENVQNGLALVRPPGHHAMKEEFCGFCIFNSVAIAARRALDQGKKVLIVDFDAHHGQATQQEFFQDPRVLYISLHRYEFGAFWPHLRESDYDFIGEGDGIGYNVNVPLNKVGMKNQDYLAVLHQLILPMAHEFSPDVVLVSAGYDAALGCPEGEMLLTPQFYGHLVSNLMTLAQGKVACVMEGGYFVESLAESVAMTLRALLGDVNFTLGPIPSPNDAITDSILSCLSALRSHWQFLRVQDEYSISEYDANVDKNCHEPVLEFKGELFKEDRDLNLTKYEPGNFYLTHPPEKIAELNKEMNQIRMDFSRHLSQNKNHDKVAYVYDEVMTKHRNLENPSHPESPQRIVAIMNRLKEYGLDERMLKIDSRRAEEDEITLVHEAEYFKSMATLPKDQSELEKVADKFDSIYLNKDSFDCALLSCGSLLNVVDCVCNGDSGKGIAVIRPPGHHAESDEACGFCVFNNVSVAAKYAIKSHGLKRVLILDWDVHHGNGIQNMFYEDPQVLYISMHRYDWGTFFPGRSDANFDYFGAGPGEGFNINIPWNGAGMGDAEYLSAFLNVVLPIAYQFDPELVLVSAGFDAARGDPLGKCKVSPEMYGLMVKYLQNLANGKVIIALEGGYNTNSISLSFALCAKALLGDPLPSPTFEKSVKSSAIQSIRDVIEVHQKFWSCLRFGKRLPDNFPDLKSQLIGSPKKKEIPGVKDVKDKDAEYIPGEYGSSGQSSVVSTLSQSKNKNYRDLLVDSGTRANVNEAAKGLSGLSVDTKRTSTGDAQNKSDYIPFEYGGNFGSGCVNTISSASSGAKCTLKNTLEKTIMETDENKKTS